MSRTFTQKEIVEFLKDNPVNATVHVGDLPNMNGDNYIFLDYLSENLISYDNEGCYKTSVQISIYTKEFSNRKIITDYVKELCQFNITYQGSDEGNYFVAILTSEVFING